MEQTTQQIPETAAGSSGPGEVHERRRGRYEAILGGVSGGAASLLYGFGAAILPSSTRAEQGLILGTALALGVALWTGFGAWRSLRRFTITGIAAAMAIICLATLSIVASDFMNAQPKTSGGPVSTPAPGPAGSSAAISPASPHAASSSPAPQASASAGPPAYLADMTPDSGATDAPMDHTWTMQGHPYAHSLGYAGQFCGPTETVRYNLAGHFQWFQATAGINDDAGPDDQGAATNDGAEFTVKANTGGGPTKTIFDEREHWGSPFLVHVSVAGATILELETSTCFSDPSSVAVWGSASLLP